MRGLKNSAFAIIKLLWLSLLSQGLITGIKLFIHRGTHLLKNREATPFVIAVIYLFIYLKSST